MADLEARYVAAVTMADYLADALERSLGVQREGQLGIAAAALARYQGWRSTLEGGSDDGTRVALVLDDDTADLLRDAADLIRRLHAALPDDGATHGTAPSWWELGTAANGMQARIAALLKGGSDDGGRL